MPLRGSGNRSSGKLIKAYTQKDIGPAGLEGDSPRAVTIVPTTTGPGIIAATGGTETTYTSGPEQFKVHTFTGSGTFVVTAGPSGALYHMDVLVVGGGGGGKGDGADPLGPYGGNRNAGSGGGGMLSGALPIPHAVPVDNYTMPITIGAGGSGDNGSATIFNLDTIGPTATCTALGGGAGGAGDGSPGCDGNPGGSGGGGWYIHPGEGGEGTQTASGGLSGYGNDGYPGTSSPEYGGSGGGAGAGGGRGAGAGAGLANDYQTGSNQTYAAGGESSDFPSTPRNASGSANTGTGAGGFGTGGSGIVVIRYRTNL